MFEIIKQRIRDARTLKTLCFGAERLANEQGQREPGAEHFVLAAFDLDDATAQLAFAELGVTRAAFAAAIEAQYCRALASVGLNVDDDAAVVTGDLHVPTPRGPYRSQASAQGLMQVLTRDIMKNEQQRDAATPLLGAHVLLAAGASTHGVCARSFDTLGLSRARVAEVARATIAAHLAAAASA